MKSMPGYVISKPGVKTLFILLMVLFLVFTVYSVTTGAPGIPYGDVNDDGEIDVRDVVLVMRYVLEVEDLTNDQIKAADVTADGEVNVRDATMIMQYALGLIDEFPAYTKVESVDDVEITVSYGTKYEDINFPGTVTATLYDDTEEEIDVEWAEESDPEYNPRSSGKYEFEGELVDLPAGVSNPDEVKAKAVVTVRHRDIPPPTRKPDPEPDQYTISLASLTGEGYVEVESNNETTDLEAETDSFNVEDGTEVTITAIAEEGWEFEEWGEDASGETAESFEVTIEEDYDIGVSFSQLKTDPGSLKLDPASAVYGEEVELEITYTLGEDLVNGEVTITVPEEFDVVAHADQLKLPGEDAEAVNEIAGASYENNVLNIEDFAAFDEDTEIVLTLSEQPVPGVGEYTFEATSKTEDKEKSDSAEAKFVVKSANVAFTLSPQESVYYDVNNYDAGCYVYAKHDFDFNNSANGDFYGSPGEYVYGEEAINFEAIDNGEDFSYNNAYFEFEFEDENQVDQLLFEAAEAEQFDKENLISFEQTNSTLKSDPFDEITHDHYAKWIPMFSKEAIEDNNGEFVITFRLLSEDDQLITKKTVIFYVDRKGDSPPDDWDASQSISTFSPYWDQGY